VSQVNLLPPELRQRQATRRSTSLAVAGGFVLIAVVVLVWYLRGAELQQKQADLADQQAVNARVQAEIVELQKYGDLQTQLQTKQQLVGQVYANEVSWSGILLDVSRVIPADAYLTAMNGQIGAADAGAAGAGATAPSTSLVGSISFTGNVKGADTLAAWLTRLEQVNGWVNAWANSANESGPFSRIYQFQSGVDLSSDVVTKRGKGEQP
jgi:Tfp pilus assembly protein PilN